MSIPQRVSSKHVVLIGVIAATTFGYFTGALLVVGTLTAPTAVSSTGLLVRALVAVVVSAALVIAEVRRAQATVGDAMLEGVRLAAVVIVADNLTGVSDSGFRLALRAAMLLIGLAGLWALTHVLVRATRTN